MSSQAFCAVCGSPYRLRKDGMIPRHQRLVLAYTYGARDHHEPCPGSGKSGR